VNHSKAKYSHGKNVNKWDYRHAPIFDAKYMAGIPAPRNQEDYQAGRSGVGKKTSRKQEYFNGVKQEKTPYFGAAKAGKVLCQ